jgi:hypothetical protein
MQREHLGQTEMRVLTGASHELPDFVPTVRRALLWVTR